MEMEQFYRDILGIHLSDLSYIRWNEVVETFIRVHQQHRAGMVFSDPGHEGSDGSHNSRMVLLSKENVTELDIVSRILRKENYMVAMINKVLHDPANMSYCDAKAYV